MSEPSFYDIEYFLRNLALPFYQIERDMPVTAIKGRLENNAEHSWTLALSVCAIAPRIDPKLDVGKACMLAVVHDLVEIFAGDTSVWAEDVDLATKHQRELVALLKIKKQFSNFSYIIDLIEEYETKASQESIFVYALDKFMAMLTVYADEGEHFRNLGRTIDDFRTVVSKHRAKAHVHKKIGAYYDELMDAFEKHPEYFHPG